MSLKYYCDIHKAEIEPCQQSTLTLLEPNGEVQQMHLCPKCHYKVEQAILKLIPE